MGLFDGLHFYLFQKFYLYIKNCNLIYHLIFTDPHNIFRLNIVKLAFLCTVCLKTIVEWDEFLLESKKQVLTRDMKSSTSWSRWSKK